jgi:hypothetical protein
VESTSAPCPAASRPAPPGGSGPPRNRSEVSAKARSPIPVLTGTEQVCTSD